MADKYVHWFGPLLRELRRSSGLSLAQFQEKTGVPAVVMGSYERGDRKASLDRAEDLLAFFGKKIVVVDAEGTDSAHIRTREELAGMLREAASLLENR